METITFQCLGCSKQGQVDEPFRAACCTECGVGPAEGDVARLRKRELCCPSATSRHVESCGGVIFGVVGGTVQTPRVEYLPQAIPVTPEALELANPAAPDEVFRMASPCLQRACIHFENDECRLAARVVQFLPTTVPKEHACALRENCVWWHQEGNAACGPCTSVVTRCAHRSPVERLVGQTKD